MTHHALPNFHFVVRHPEWNQAIERGDPIDLDRDTWRATSPNVCWIATTYVRLRDAGFTCTAGRDLAPEAINVVSLWDVGARDAPWAHYCVVCRNDGPEPWFGQHVVVQNACYDCSGRNHHLDLWPQPGLLPRDETRGDRIEALFFPGTVNNLRADFRSGPFIRRLEELGVQLHIADIEDGRAPDWRDYRQRDLVLAIRSLTTVDQRHKPASKLINSWLAGVPAILGREPAFRALRRDRYDYLEAQTPDEVLRAIDRLKSEPDLYRRHREQCRRRAPAYTVEAMVERWVRYLTGPVTAGWYRWIDEDHLSRTVRGWATAPYLLARRALIRRRYLAYRDRGPRPFDRPHEAGGRPRHDEARPGGAVDTGSSVQPLARGSEVEVEGRARRQVEQS